MAVVWLARDLKHDRPVAIKILRPELGAVIGADRFRREIHVTAALQHPHILPLHDSGECAGLLYYVMPYVDGETLRDRLVREGPLPLDEALRLAAEVGGALGHAHRHGVIHRDVKPENVLLADGQALVADFGIARGDGGQRLTETGMSLGTPAYMSPEQGAGDTTDARSDQYALATLTYEMLAGEPPFTGPTAQAVIAKQVSQPAPSLRTTRPSVPAHVDAALQRALAKAAADRYGTVADFVDALLHAPAGIAAPATRTRGGKRARSMLVPGAVVVLVLLAVLAQRRFGAGRAGDVAVDPEAVAVLPFRTDGADPSLAYLGEGMVDLVAVKLPGGGGLRAVEPRSALAAWRAETGRETDVGVRVAHRLGAGLVLDGSVVGAPSAVTLSGALRNGQGGRIVGSAQVSGPVDSLPLLVDRLVVALLAGRSGITVQQLAGISSVVAIREYLAGKAAHRAARYAEAVRHFDAALQEDSTFALAALWALPASWRLGDVVVEDYGSRAFRMRRRLHGADSIMLHAFVGDTVPDERSIVASIADLERAAVALPDRAEIWFELGDRQLHFGELQDYPDALPRAKRSLERALALDSSYALPVDHLLLLALHQQDSAAAARLAPLYRRTGSRGDRAGAFDWILAELLRDSTRLAELRAAMPRMPRPSLEWLQGLPMLETGSIDVSRAAAAELLRQASTEGEVRAAAYRAWVTDLNAGRPSEAEAQARRWMAASGPAPLIDFLRVVAADLWDGDRAAGAAALERLASMREAGDRYTRDGPGFAACASGLHGVTRPDVKQVEEALVRLRRLLPETPEATALDGNRRLCAALLEAAVAVARRRDDARARLARADSVFIYSSVVLYSYYPVVAAGLHSALGDDGEALRLLRRRAVGLETAEDVGLLTTTLRAEARLAAAMGDTVGAVRALRHFLALRSDPEPSLAAQRDSVRQSLAAVLREPRRDVLPEH